MRLGALIAVVILVLVTLVDVFPQVIRSSDADAATAEGRSINMQDHMNFTRELAAQGTQLGVLKSQHDAMAGLPERIARIEERLDTLGRMIYATLGGILSLLLKEVWTGMKSLRSRRMSNGAGRSNYDGDD